MKIISSISAISIKLTSDMNGTRGWLVQFFEQVRKVFRGSKT